MQDVCTDCEMPQSVVCNEHHAIWMSYDEYIPTNA